MFPHVIGYSSPIYSLTVTHKQKGMDWNGKYQELFQKGEDRNVNWA